MGFLILSQYVRFCIKELHQFFSKITQSLKNIETLARTRTGNFSNNQLNCNSTHVHNNHLKLSGHLDYIDYTVYSFCDFVFIRSLTRIGEFTIWYYWVQLIILGSLGYSYATIYIINFLSSSRIHRFRFKTREFSILL